MLGGNCLLVWSVPSLALNDFSSLVRRLRVLLCFSLNFFTVAVDHVCALLRWLEIRSVALLLGLDTWVSMIFRS